MNREVEISWLAMIGYNAYEHPFDNGTHFYNIARGFVNLFPTFANDLKFNETHILASRIYLQFSRLFYNSSDGLLVDQLRTVVQQSHLPITGRTPLLLMEESIRHVRFSRLQFILVCLNITNKCTK